MRLYARDEWPWKFLRSLCSDQNIHGSLPSEVPAFEQKRAAVCFNEKPSGISHLLEVPNIPPRENL